MICPTVIRRITYLRGPRGINRFFSTDAASHPANKTQVYISHSRDPLLNLSVEHHLLQSSPPDSTILTLYVNSPCIIFGRNQNPWLEANLSEMARLDAQGKHVQLVRRRSGGGTVFHDHGNVNFSVICPPESFNRDKHAEMVVRALKGLGRPNTRVNARHDIVIDENDGTFKISGSAYKLTRLRSLHHGTCLLRSPNLGKISTMLRSPAEGLIKARGVDSVRSPVRNVEVGNDEFEDAVVNEFGKMYGDFDIYDKIHHDAALEVEKIQAGYKELQSRNWIYGQTPRFTFCTHATEEDDRPRTGLPFDTHLRFDARQGILERFDIAEQGIESLVGTNIQDVRDWTTQLKDAGTSINNVEQVGSWMNQVLGTSFTKPV